MNSIATELNKARDVAANYALIEQEEIAVELDGRQHFEQAVAKAIVQDEATARDILGKMKPFTTTSWKVPHSEAYQGRITWPWALPR